MLTSWLDVSRTLVSRWSPFPHVTTKAWYDYFSQAITFTDITSDELRRSVSTDDVSLKLRVWPLLVHELQHFCDHVATTWGQEEVERLFYAYSARVGGEMAKFKSVSELIRELRRYDYSDYYTEQYEAFGDTWDGKPWRYDRTVGYELLSNGEIDRERPIQMYRFSTQGRRPICRVPLGTSALLELRAMAAEYSAHLSVAQDLDERQRLAEIRLWSDSVRQSVYDPVLCKYSVAAHYVANVCTYSDILDAYLTGARLAGIALMLRPDEIAQMTLPDELKQIPGVNAALRRGDRVLAYMSLVDALRRLGEADAGSSDRLLVTAGIADFQPQPKNSAAPGQFSAGIIADRLDDLIDAGAVMWTTEGPVVRDPPALPAIICADNVIMASTTLRRVPADRWISQACALHGQIREFVDATF